MTMRAKCVAGDHYHCHLLLSNKEQLRDIPIEVSLCLADGPIMLTKDCPLERGIGLSIIAAPDHCGLVVGSICRLIISRKLGNRSGAAHSRTVRSRSKSHRSIGADYRTIGV